MAMRHPSWPDYHSRGSLLLDSWERDSTRPTRFLTLRRPAAKSRSISTRLRYDDSGSVASPPFAAYRIPVWIPRLPRKNGNSVGTAGLDTLLCGFLASALLFCPPCALRSGNPRTCGCRHRSFLTSATGAIQCGNGCIDAIALRFQSLNYFWNVHVPQYTQGEHRVRGLVFQIA